MIFMIKEYKEQIKYFLTNKRYIIPIIFVAILSYGFTVTNYSIGVDDLCFDKYVTGPYILSAGRWGTWCLYNLLNIVDFTPFWLDFLVAIFMVIIAITLCAFLRKQLNDKISLSGFLFFSSLIISSPLINHFYIYEPTNLSIVVSNLWIIISEIILFETYFNKKTNKKSTYILITLLMSIPISMYESCAQTFMVLVFVFIFIKIIQGENTYKNLIKYLCINVGILICSIVVYLIIGKIVTIVINAMGIGVENRANKQIIWIDDRFVKEDFKGKIRVLKYLFGKQLVEQSHELPYIISFGLLNILIFIIELIKSIKNKNAIRPFLILGITLSNIVLIALQALIFIRMQFSWIITIAFFGIYLYNILIQKGKLKYLLNAVAIIFILIQTRNLNQFFYNDYRRFERDKIIANEIGRDLVKMTDYRNKPIVYIKTEVGNDETFIINYDNGQSIFSIWGIKAFDNYGEQITVFINNFGYKFKNATNEETKEAVRIYKALDEGTKKKNIIELEKYILVNLDVYQQM